MKTRGSSIFCPEMDVTCSKKTEINQNIVFGSFGDLDAISDDDDLDSISEDENILKDDTYLPFELFKRKSPSNRANHHISVLAGLADRSTIEHDKKKRAEPVLKNKNTNQNHRPLEKAIDLEPDPFNRRLYRSVGSPMSEIDFSFKSHSSISAQRDEIKVPKIQMANPCLKEAISYKDISLVEIIGVGSTGKVWKGQWKGRTVAVKEAKNIICEDDLEKEANMLKQVSNHRNVVQFYGITLQPLRIVTEFMERGSLHDLLRNKHISLDWTELGRIALEAAQGVAHLHSKNIIHRDLAARNFLVDGNMHIRVADFGFSRVVKEEYSHGSTESAFPFKWTAPEVVRANTRRHRYDIKTDIFSFGVVLFEIFTRQEPWHNESGISAFILVQQGYRLPLPHSWPESLKQLVAACWAQKPKSRPASMEEVLDALSNTASLSLIGELELNDEIEII